MSQSSKEVTRRESALRKLATPKGALEEMDDSLHLDKKSPKLSQRHNKIPFVPLRSSNTRSA